MRIMAARQVLLCTWAMPISYKTVVASTGQHAVCWSS